MVNNTEKTKEIVLKGIRKNPRGISITGLMESTGITRSKIRIALAYLLGAGKIEEERASMAKLYYLK